MKPTLALLLFISATTPAARAQRPDSLDQALEQVGLRREELGWRPKGWWPRWPQAPYRARAFDDLFAQPLDVIPFARALAGTALERLDPAELDKSRGRGCRNLYLAVQSLGIDPKFGGFRGYTTNLRAQPTPLDQALAQLLAAAHRSARAYSFGHDLPYPKTIERLTAQLKRLPAGVSPILGQLVLNLVDARRWCELAFRRVEPAARQAVARRYDIGEEMIDAYDFAPEVDDLARALDEASLWYAAQKCVQALDDARVALQKLALGEVADFAIDQETPWGWIRIRGGGADAIDGEDSLLIVDLGGDDTYRGGAGARGADLPLALVLDLGGADHYGGERPAQGAGLCGVGILIDAGGDDVYEARCYAQGVGQFGFGLCADLGGDDQYRMRFSGQGCGYFGIGLLLDCAGADRYQLHGDGQGLGGVGGVGVLADRSGSDRYTAVREHSATGRPSYHSTGLDVAVSNAQGCGMGRRGDGSDGHCWAGGLGALLDGGGDDVYRAGNWAMGTGYWFGIGILHDRAGDDRYHGVAYSQGSGAHFCIGALIDEAGDDEHLSEGNARNSCAWAHDFTAAILLDGGGNDVYDVASDGLCYALNRSLALLIDRGGDDVYRSQTMPHPAVARNPVAFRSRDGVATYFALTSSLALFLEIGGADQYWCGPRNDTRWLDPEEPPEGTARNFGLGVDRSAGVLELGPAPPGLLPGWKR